LKIKNVPLKQKNVQLKQNISLEQKIKSIIGIFRRKKKKTQDGPVVM